MWDFKEQAVVLTPWPATAKDCARQWRGLLLLLGMVSIGLAITAKRNMSENVAWTFTAPQISAGFAVIVVNIPPF